LFPASCKDLNLKLRLRLEGVPARFCFCLGMVGFAAWMDVHGRSMFQVVGLLLLDFLFVGVYATKGFSGTMNRYYGYKIAAHTASGMVLLLAASVGLAAAAFADMDRGWSLPWGSWLRLVRLCEVVLGLSTIAAGATALALARYTSGLKGYNWAGYTLYSLLWISTGLRLLSMPGSSLRAREPLEVQNDSHWQDIYTCFVVTHAFIFCRIFTVAFKPLGMGYNITYAVGTAVATLATLAMAYGMWGVQAWAVSNIACVSAEWAGTGEYAHTRGAHNSLASSRAV